MIHVPINVKSPNNISKWQIGFNSAFKGLTGNCTTRNFMICTPHQILFGLSNQERDGSGGGEEHIGFWWEKLR
jgi:hypothetical protein